MLRRYHVFRAYRLFQELDRLLNHATGGTYPETLSARWGKRRKGCRFCHMLCVFLDVVDRGHCARSQAYYEAIHEGMKEMKEALDNVNDNE